MKKIFQCSFFCQLVLIILISITNVTYAETENLTIKNITEAKESIEELIERKQHGINSLKQDKTPLYTLIAIRDALRHKRWEEAGKYLDMRFVPKEISEQGAGELIRKLSLVWTQQKVLDF